MCPEVEMVMGPPPELMELLKNIDQKLLDLSEKVDVNPEVIDFLLSLETKSYRISKAPEDKKEEIENLLNWNLIQDYFFDSEKNYVHNGCANPKLTRGYINNPLPVDGKCFYNFKPLDKESEEIIKQGKFNGEPGLMMCKNEEEEKPSLYYLGSSKGKFGPMVEGEADSVEKLCEDIDGYCPLSKVEFGYEIEDLNRVVGFIEEDLKKDLSEEDKKTIEEGVDKIKDYFIEEMETLSEESEVDEENLVNALQSYRSTPGEGGIRSDFEVR